VTPTDSVQLRDLFTRVRRTFDHEDTASALELIAEAERRKCLGGFGYQAVTHLESFPDNLAANFVAAEAYRTNPDTELRDYADKYYRDFARIANVERRDVEVSRRGYTAFRSHAAAEAVRSYSVADSAMDNEDDLAALASDAATAELSHDELDNLQVAALAAHVHSVSQSLQAVSAELDQLL